MERFRLTWLLSLSLMGGGSLCAHGLAYRIAVPDPAFTKGAHSYLAAAPAFLALCLTVSLAALVGFAVAGARGERLQPAPAWVFALLPPLGFALQEHLERLLHDGSFPLLAALEPTFLVGLLLQLPFALAALAAARALTGFVETLGKTLRELRPRHLRRSPPALRPVAEPALPRLRALAAGWAERGPPLPVSV